MLEARRIRGVTGDRHAHILGLHNRHAFGHIVGTVAHDGRARTLRERLLLDNLELFRLVIKRRLHIRKAIDTADDISRILAQTVENHAEIRLADLVGVKRNLDRTFRRRKRFMPGEKRKAFRRIVEKHRPEIAVAEADLAVFSNRTGNAERLQPNADFRRRVLGLGATLLDRHRRAHRVGPLGVLKADWLGFFNNLVGIDAGSLADFGAFGNRLDAVGLERGENLRLAAFVAFEQLLGDGLRRGLLGAFLSTCHFSYLLIPCADRYIWPRLRTGRNGPLPSPRLRSG